MALSEITKNEELLLCNFEDRRDLYNHNEDDTHIRNLWTCTEWDRFTTNDLVTITLLKYHDELHMRNIFNTLEPINIEKTFAIGIGCFLSFIQSNFTGNDLSEHTRNFIDELNLKDKCRNLLSIDDTEIDVNVIYPELLLVAKSVFEYCKLENSNLQAWWYMRYAIIHQHLLDERSETLYARVRDKIQHFNNWNIPSRLQAKLHVELAQFHLLYGEVNEAEKCLNTSKEILGLTFQLVGALGKRTKHQQRDIAQIKLNITTNKENKRIIDAANIPEILALDDDVRLNEIKYQTEHANVQLPILEQTVLLSTIQHLLKASPNDSMKSEESFAYIHAMLQQKHNWCIRLNTLVLRCLIESMHKRTIERSLSQYELFISYYNNELPIPTNRLSSVWSTGTLPIWKINANMAEVTLNLGLVKAALDIYLRLQMWEEVIVCYTIMELRHKAAEIINTQLKSNPTVKLWCLLGDATDDISCYEKAWELSEQKSSRAQRHWGNYLFARKNYAECIPHLQKSLEINTLQNIVWLRLGFAALEVQDWKLAASAYRRYTNLEPGGFEAWNNLSKAYVKLDEKVRAHFALTEALKFSFDNWKIWDNFMLVSAAISNFSDVIRAYHQILDLKEKHLDTEILMLLTNHIMENNDNDAFTSNGRLVIKARELFGRLTSIYPNDSPLWEMYADISPTAELKAQRLSRAYRGLVQDNWATNLEKCGKVLEICQRIGEAVLEAKSSSLMSSARLTLRSAVAAARKQEWEQHKNSVKECENLVEKITKSIF